MNRTEIRYALFRCKVGTSELKHSKILKSYETQLKEFDLDISEFTTEWDIDPLNTSEIVIGKVAKNLNKDKSLFSGDGNLKVK